MGLLNIVVKVSVEGHHGFVVLLMFLRFNVIIFTKNLHEIQSVRGEMPVVNVREVVELLVEVGAHLSLGGLGESADSVSAANGKHIY